MTPTPTAQNHACALIVVYAAGGDTAQILTLDPTTGEQTILGTVPVDSVQLRSGVYGMVAWSSDRQLVTVSRVTDGAQAMALLDLAGRNVPVNVPMESYVSPQGDRLAGFGGDWGGGTYGLVVTDLTGTVLQRLSLPADLTFQTAVAWSPDGSALIVDGFLASEQPHRRLVAVAGTMARQYGRPLEGVSSIVLSTGSTTTTELGQSLSVGLGSGAMSPDSSTIVAPTYCSTPCPTGLVSIDVSTGEATELTTGKDDGSSMVAPKATRITFRTQERGTARGIWVMDADGSNLTRLTTPARPDHDYSMSWSPDGTSILFSRGNTSHTGLGDLYVGTVTGGDPPLLVEPKR